MKEKKDLLINIAYYGILILCVVVLIKYVVPATIPFLLGYGVAALVCKTTSKYKKHKKLIRIIASLIFYVIVGGLISWLFLEIFSSVSEGVVQIPALYENVILPVAKTVYAHISQIINELDPELMTVLKVIADALASSLKNWVGVLSEFIVGLISDIVAFVPSIFISTVIMIISTFFFVVDYERMNEFFKEKAPQKWRDGLEGVKYYIFNTLLVVIRSYLIIMILTFTELSIMFWVCGIGYPFLIASVIAVFDIMPVLGTGGIMIPWAVAAFVLGDYILGIELLVMYIIVTVVRNYVEPRVVGVQLGLHPIVTLISMFIGLKVFGFLGLFGLPIAISYFWKRKKS